MFIDGCHGFPVTIIDWFYGAGRLRRNGVVVFDDVQLPQVSLLIETFLAPDDRWQELETTPKWAAYRRLSEGLLSEDWSKQIFSKQEAQISQPCYTHRKRRVLGRRVGRQDAPTAARLGDDRLCRTAPHPGDGGEVRHVPK